mmetsp:Transcript_21152/g.36034  ORF Transcript_21152/g.36034 Transcript_21152/m.36034 type:complete len:81 (-) Transcript_21152:47-289(-)
MVLAKVRQEEPNYMADKAAQQTTCQTPEVIQGKWQTALGVSTNQTDAGETAPSTSDNLCIVWLRTSHGTCQVKTIFNSIS